MSTGTITLNRLLLGTDEKTVINQEELQEFIVEPICNLFTEFIARIVAETHAVKVGVRKNVSGKGSKLDVPAREIRSTEKKKCRLCRQRSFEHCWKSTSGTSQEIRHRK